MTIDKLNPETTFPTYEAAYAIAEPLNLGDWKYSVVEVVGGFKIEVRDDFGGFLGYL